MDSRSELSPTDATRSDSTARESERSAAQTGAVEEAGRHTAGARVLIIDDEPQIQRAIRTHLGGLHFAVEGAATGAEGMDEVARWHPDVVILDLSLPDMDGIEVCRQLRTWSQVPIIVLSVRSADADKVAALELGADDYLTKPFSSQELVARVRVALRHAARGAGSSEAQFQTGGLVLDFNRRRVTVDGREIHLTPTEYEVLKYLAMNAGKVITHHTLLRAVWGPNYESEDHYLHVFIGQVRRKIESVPTRPQYLLTEPGIGYRLRMPD
jgi:two-component system, OmpR family, KDP operon response regulator KdpE